MGLNFATTLAEGCGLSMLGLNFRYQNRNGNIFLCYVDIHTYMGGCQNYDPSLGTLNIRLRIKLWTQEGTLILTTTHMCECDYMRMHASLHVYMYTFIHAYIHT